MSERQRVTNVVHHAIEQLNEQLAKEERLDVRPDAPILGPSAKLDSLGFVNLIVMIEAGLEAEFNRPFLLVDETISLDGGPFSSVATLIDYVVGMIEPEKW